MKFFKRNNARTKSPLSDKAAGWIASGILKAQNKFAKVLGKMSASWKTKQQLVFLYLVSIVLGGLSVTAIIKPFDKKAENNVSKPATIKTPRMIPDETQNSVTITDKKVIPLCT